MDTEPSPKIDPSSDMDTELVATIHCINCGTDVSQRRRHKLILAEVVAVLRHWIGPQIIQDHDLICHSCWIVALNASNIDNDPSSSKANSHHRHICVSCGKSLLRKRSHAVTTKSERETRIRKMIVDNIMPRQLRGSDQICHPCWQRFDRQAAAPAKPLPSVIYLPNLSRAADSQSHCFFPECRSKERHTVPHWLRVKLFIDYKFYVPPTCKICKFHLVNDNWEILGTIPQPIHHFTANHVEDFSTFVSERCLTLDFNNIEEMSDDLMRHWVGLTKEQFKQLLLSLPQLQNKPKGQLALAAYLIKLKTGDPDVRISSILNIPRSTLTRLMSLARKALE